MRFQTVVRAGRSACAACRSFFAVGQDGGFDLFVFDVFADAFADLVFAAPFGAGDGHFALFFFFRPAAVPAPPKWV